MLISLAAAAMLMAGAGQAASAATRWQCKETGDLLGATPGHGHLTFTATAKVKLTAQNTALGDCLHHRYTGRPINPRSCKSEGCQQIGG